MGVRVISSLGGLSKALASKPRELRTGAGRVAREAANDGQKTARRIAIRTAGKHGKHYPKAITVERLGASVYEYGPDSALPQGGMSFEGGSRNQPPHLDIAHSYDLMKPSLHRSVDSLLDGLFW